MEKDYNAQDRLDEILDKILEYDLKSLTINEMDFLNSWSLGLEEQYHIQLLLEETNIIFENDYFKYEFIDKIIFEDEVHYVGVLYVPDLILENGNKVIGKIEGVIISYSEGVNELEFEKDGYDILEFCTGIEYELDSFVDYIISNLK